MAEQVVEPGVGWSYQVNFSDQRQKKPRSLVAQMHLPLSASPEELNKHLDAIRDATERQIAYFELIEAEEAFADHVEKVREMEGHMIAADERAALDWENRGRHGEVQLTAAQKNEKLGAESNYRDWKAKAEYWRNRCTMLRAKVNGHASLSGADSHPGRSEG